MRKVMRYPMCALAMLLSTPLLRADLIADVMAAAGPPVWSYTLLNNEAANSPNFISSFSLAVNAPITVTSTPIGWDFNTDGDTFVFWFNTDAALPYPHDVAPGAFLSGFSLSSTTTTSALLSFGLSGWDHTLDQPGPTTAGTVLSPSMVSNVAETRSLVLVGIGLIGFLLARWRLSLLISELPSISCRATDR